MVVERYDRYVHVTWSRQGLRYALVAALPPERLQDLARGFRAFAPS